MLRALIWRYDPDTPAGRKTLEGGHDLHQLLAIIRRLGVLSERPVDDRLAGQVQRINRLWFNNMRFASGRLVEARWRKLGMVDRRNIMKQASRRFFDDCLNVCKRCEVLCQKSKSNGS